MGIILIITALSDLLLNSGARIIKGEIPPEHQISVGMEIYPGYRIDRKYVHLFKKRGYNYYYLKNTESVEDLERFLYLLKRDSIFINDGLEKPRNLLHFVLNDFQSGIAPLLNVTVGVTSGVDVDYIAEMFSSISDSLISNLSMHELIQPVQGKHIFCEGENFIANISPNPHEEPFLPFLVFLQILGNRGYRIEFSPEAAPAPFIVNFDRKNYRGIFKEPDINEINRGKRSVSEWIESIMSIENRSRLLILSAQVGIDIGTLNGWIYSLREVKNSEIYSVWLRYLNSGFVVSADEYLCDSILELFPESEIIR